MPDIVAICSIAERVLMIQLVVTLATRDTRRVTSMSLMSLLLSLGTAWNHGLAMLTNHSGKCKCQNAVLLENKQDKIQNIEIKSL
jgi:hypothetical protein